MSAPPLPRSDAALLPIRATVSAGAIDTEYLRGGHGLPVVLLSATPGRESARAFVALAAGFRVLAPRVPDEGVGFDEWLRGFLDCLGVSDATLVADAALEPAVAAFAAAEPERVRRVVSLAEARDAAALTTLLASPSR